MLSGKKPSRERRGRERRAFPDYLQLVNHQTGKLVGDLADISPDGFKLESSKPIPVSVELHFRMDLPPEISQNSFIVFTARCRWCQPHPVDGRLYEAGFEIMDMNPSDSRTFERIYDRYRSAGTGRDQGTGYLWRT